ncbi:hypothetical protein [Planobispora rosea]|uniref:hypothetical protein n=1 Tax=Planobispora rosea TaxID=35762 RepID=UPI001670C101|nr:hypothetical protein [Planobispora rosea]
MLLTNQERKRRLARTPPFGLAHQIFSERALVAEKWLIAGYGFGDGIVNDELTHLWKKRTKAGKHPRVLVVTYGETLAERVISKVLPGRDDEQVRVCRRGLPQALEHDEWMWQSSREEAVAGKVSCHSTEGEVESCAGPAPA